MTVKLTMMQDHDFMPIFYFENMLFVPHYSKKGIWVLPGGQERTAKELLKAGCKESSRYLWPRAWCTEKDKR